MSKSKQPLTEKEERLINSKKGLMALLRQNTLDPKKAIRSLKYEKRLGSLQEELLIMQQWVVKNNKKVVIIFEGRDAAGKGGAIRRITEYLPPREIRVVALPKPNEVEQGQWYFQRYINLFPREGQIVFFDRSWYNRAIVEPVNNFCTKKQYSNFMDQVNEVERMMLLSGITVVKLYFSISKTEQQHRFKEIASSPVKKWKYSNVDKNALDLWDDYTKYKELMFKNTQKYVPWKVIKANKKTSARIMALEYILQKIPYEVKDLENIRHQAMIKETME